MHYAVLHDYQKPLVEALVNRPRLGLFVDMGLGKTFVTLTALDILFKMDHIHRVFLIAPRAVLKSWESEIKKFPHLDSIKSTIFQNNKRYDSNANLFITNPEQLGNFIKKHDMKTFDTLVIDESTLFKNPGSDRFKLLKTIIKYNRFPRRIILTGTPIPQGYLDLWSQIYILDNGERLGTYFSSWYRMVYFQKKGLYKYELLPDAESKILDKISDIVIYKDTESAGLELPNLIHFVEFEALDNDKQLMYQKLKKEAFLQFESQLTSDKNITALTAAALTNKLLQFSSGFLYRNDKSVIEIHEKKLELLDKIFQKTLDESILIVYNYKHEGYKISKKYPHAVPLHKDNIDAWNAGAIKLGYFQARTLARGVNLQAGGRILVWFGFTWELELYLQTNKRLHRQGQKRDVYCYHLCTCPIEYRLLNALNVKKQTQQQLFDYLKKEVVDEIRVSEIGESDSDENHSVFGT